MCPDPLCIVMDWVEGSRDLSAYDDGERLRIATDYLQHLSAILLGVRPESLAEGERRLEKAVNDGTPDDALIRFFDRRFQRRRLRSSTTTRVFGSTTCRRFPASSDVSGRCMESPNIKIR